MLKFPNHNKGLPIANRKLMSLSVETNCMTYTGSGEINSKINCRFPISENMTYFRSRKI